MTEAAEATRARPTAEPAPPAKVKEALDEARTLVLGVQVLLGFQYAALFQTALPARRWLWRSAMYGTPQAMLQRRRIMR